MAPVKEQFEVLERSKVQLLEEQGESGMSTDLVEQTTLADLKQHTLDLEEFNTDLRSQLDSLQSET